MREREGGGICGSKGLEGFVVGSKGKLESSFFRFFFGFGLSKWVYLGVFIEVGKMRG